MSLFLRLLGEDDKAAALREVCAQHRTAGRDARLFDVPPHAFDGVPGKPFAYWVSEAVRETFAKLPAMESDERTARRGPSTCDDLRYLRLWWEVTMRHHGRGEWRNFSKGGVIHHFMQTFICLWIGSLVALLS